MNSLFQCHSKGLTQCRRVRERVRNLNIVFKADDFPRFLWEGESTDLRDLNKGFLRGEILIRVGRFSQPVHPVLTKASQTMLAILLGPSVAQTGEGSGAGGYADKFGMRTITIPTIAFAAVLVSSFNRPVIRVWLCANLRTQARHALTTDTKFIWAGDGNRFSYLQFYNTIIGTVSGWSQTEKAQLIGWWNRYVISKYLANWSSRTSTTYAFDAATRAFDTAIRSPLANATRALNTATPLFPLRLPVTTTRSRVLARLREGSRMTSQLDNPRPDSIAALMQQQRGAGV